MVGALRDPDPQHHIFLTLNSLPNLRSSSSWDLCCTVGAEGRSDTTDGRESHVKYEKHKRDECKETLRRTEVFYLCCSFLPVDWTDFQFAL